ncbi:MAG: DNA cytosine methyltransferase [Candidatus Erginobacter occultus]|nr:DNA cytosine methyltransferase [Candidatus Erginobacter occultus]
MANNRQYNVLDLFAGCGGLSSGLVRAGFRVVAANDVWEPAAETYRLNHPGTAFILGDITGKAVRDRICREFERVPCDVIAGGPPCQAYSMAGARSVDDARGHLFGDYVEIVERLRPAIFIMENVKGILTMMHDREVLSAGESAELERVKCLEAERAALMLKRKQAANTGRVVFSKADQSRLDAVKQELRRSAGRLKILREPVTSKIVRRFNGIGYRVEFRTLNAADYGVPQKRERVFFIGTDRNVPIEFPLPTHCPPEASGELPLFSSSRLPWRTVRSAIDDLKQHPEDQAWSHVFPRHKSDFVAKIHKTKIGTTIYKGYSDAWYRNPPDDPARTVKENHGGVLVHYELDRVMTPRELARLQSFPDNFNFRGSKSLVLKQIGNAVPPLLGEAVGRALLKMLSAIEGEASLSAARKTA